MYKIKVLVVEDDLLIAADIVEGLERHNLDVMPVCVTGEEAILKVEQEIPDLVLMDIKLNGKTDGIEAARVIKSKHNIPVIFLTDYTDNATVQRVKGTFPANYLGKPFNEADVVRSIDIAFHNSLRERKKNSKKGMKATHVLLKEGFKYVKIRYKDIVMLKADRSYCTLYTDNAEFTFSKSLNKIANQLQSDSLFRTHRSYIVNLQKITEMMGNMITLGKHKAELSKERREQFFEKWKFVG